MAAPSVRRRALLIGGLGAAFIGTVSGTLLAFSTTTEGAVITILRKHLSTLDLDPKGVERFAADFVRQHLKGSVSNRSWRVMRLLGPLHAHIYWPELESRSVLERVPAIAVSLERMRWLEQEVVTTFLMSSSKFWLDAELNAPVRYLALHTPASGCRNPFARYD